MPAVPCRPPLHYLPRLRGEADKALRQAKWCRSVDILRLMLLDSIVRCNKVVAKVGLAEKL